jgi:hypothetical protein
MAEKKTTSVIVLLVGLVILVLSLVADYIGLGEGTGFGNKQIVGTIVGAGIFVVGLVMMQKK